MKKLLITGGTGFVGRAMLQRLNRDREYNVRATVRNPKHLFSPEIEKTVITNISESTNWSKSLVGIDCVVHLAARAHILKDSSKVPLKKFREINVGGTLALARQAAESGVERFIFISSIGVNGITSTLPFTEDQEPKPAEPYAVSKCEAEIGLCHIAKETGLDVVIIRPPLVYGADAPGNFGLMVHAVKSSWILPLGHINNKRSMVALENLIDLIVTCIGHPAAVNQIFLAGDGEDLSTTELLQRLGRVLDKSPRLIPLPASILNFILVLLGKKKLAQKLCGSLQVDISKAREMLGWEPPVTVDEALCHVVKGLKK